MSDKNDRERLTYPAELSEYFADRLEHQHQFVIPVEWEWTDYRGFDYDSIPGRKKVTVLRCFCGEETDR